MNHWSMMKNVPIEPGRGDEMTGMRIVAAAMHSEATIPSAGIRRSWRTRRVPGTSKGTGTA